MKRTIFIITLGFIIGIIWGLYLSIVSFIFLFLIFLLSIIMITKFNSKRMKNSFNNMKIFKVFVKNNTILLILISVFIGCIYINFCNNKYEKIYNEFSTGEVIATVISNPKESMYKNSYRIKLEKFNNKEYGNMYFILQIPKKINLKYGNKIKFEGQYNIPEQSKNYKGFNYREYLKTQKVYGIFKADKINCIEEDNLNVVEIYSHRIKEKIIENTEKVLPKETKELFLGILIGYDEKLQENIEESFKKSNLTHLLAVSGAHIAYISYAF